MALLDRNIEQVFLYHVRRAGGTSLRRYCERLATVKDLSYQVVEGYSLDRERYFTQSPATLHLICLRDPIERIKSSYRFEGRWPQAEPIRTVDSAKSFADWAEDTRCDDGQSNNLWQCTRNYYVKALIGYPRVGADGLGQTELALAKRRLEEFEFVLVTEWLSRPDTGAYLRHELGFHMPVPHERYPELESQEATNEELFDTDTLTRLREANWLDFELHRYARTLLQRRMRVPHVSHPSS